MKSMTFFLQSATTTANQGGGTWSFLVMLILIFFVMWLFMIRPQQKKQKELDKFRNALQKGDKVVTIGGIYGTVAEVKDNVVFINIDKDVKIKVDKASLVKDFSDAQQS